MSAAGWLLILTLKMYDPPNAIAASVAAVGPFPTVEQCVAAGDAWRKANLGSASYMSQVCVDARPQ